MKSRTHHAVEQTGARDPTASELDDRVASIMKPQPLLRKASYGAGILDRSSAHGNSDPRATALYSRANSLESVSGTNSEASASNVRAGAPSGGSQKLDRFRSDANCDDSSVSHQRAVIRRSNKEQSTGTTRMGAVAAVVTSTTSPSGGTIVKPVGPTRTQQRSVLKDDLSNRPTAAGRQRSSKALELSAHSSSPGSNLPGISLPGGSAEQPKGGFSGYFRSWLPKPSKASTKELPMVNKSLDGSDNLSFSGKGTARSGAEIGSQLQLQKGAWVDTAPVSASSNATDNGVQRFEDLSSTDVDPFAAEDVAVSRPTAHLGEAQRALERKLLEGAEDVIARRRGPSLASISRKSGWFGNIFFTPKEGMTLVTNNIVLGARSDAEDLKAMRAIGVTYVLNISDKVPNHFPDVLVYHRINIPDHASVQLKNHFADASAFIRRAESHGGRILVHCVAGASRSVAYVLMHLISVHRIRLEDAWNHVLKLRPFICPNEGFLLQLAMFEYEILGGLSVSSRTSKQWNFYAINELMARLPRASTDAPSGPRDKAALPLGEDDDNGLAAKCLYWIAA